MNHYERLNVISYFPPIPFQFNQFFIFDVIFQFSPIIFRYLFFIYHWTLIIFQNGTNLPESCACLQIPLRIGHGRISQGISNPKFKILVFWIFYLAFSNMPSNPNICWLGNNTWMESRGWWRGNYWTKMSA